MTKERRNYVSQVIDQLDTILNVLRTLEQQESTAYHNMPQPLAEYSGAGLQAQENLISFRDALDSLENAQVNLGYLAS